MREERMEGSALYRVVITIQYREKPHLLRNLVVYDDITTLDGVIDLASDWTRCVDKTKFQKEVFEPEVVEMIVEPNKFIMIPMNPKIADDWPDSMYGVICHGECGKQGLTKREYKRQMEDEDASWVCPICDGPAEFDEERLEDGRTKLGYPPLEGE